MAHSGTAYGASWLAQVSLSCLSHKMKSTGAWWADTTECPLCLRLCLVGKSKKVARGEQNQLPRCDKGVLRARKLLC